MTSSHLDTIETALVMAEAFKGMSPHLESIKEQMLAKKEGCKRTLMMLKYMRRQDGGTGYVAGREESRIQYDDQEFVVNG